MTILAFTGHRGLSVDTARLVNAALRAELLKHVAGRFTGISCLADGADELFAEAVLDLGGELHVVVPAERYREGFSANYQPIYDNLLSQASNIVILDHVESNSAAHMDASMRMIGDSDELLAVWDGKPARGYGGTADVVAVARVRDLPVTVIWPDGARRD